MKINWVQYHEMGRFEFREKLRHFLAQQDSSVQGMNDADFNRVVNDLIERAAFYGMVTEQQVASYCYVAWKLGVDFDKRFPAAQAILLSDGVTSDAKAQGLVEWCEKLLRALRGQ